MHRSLWLKAFLVLAVVWLLAAGAIFWARSARITPEKVSSYLESHPIASQSEADRAKVIEKVADQMNALSYDQRREMRMGKKLDGFFRALTPAEQSTFLDRTLPTGFKQMIESLNKMDSLKRKQFVEHSLREMKEREGEDPKLDQNARKMMDEGFKTFYSDASVEVKMDVEPLLEQLQKNLQRLQ